MSTDDPARLHGAHRKDRSAHPPRPPWPRGLLACVRAPWTVAWLVVGPVYEWTVSGRARRRRAGGPLPAPA